VDCRDPTRATDDTGRVWELDNLYVVGPAVLPTMGSPNPMLSCVSFSRRTVKRLISPDGTERNFNAGVPVGAHSLFYYAAEAFDDYGCNSAFQDRLGSTGRPVDSSGIFLRFHAPHSKGLPQAMFESRQAQVDGKSPAFLPEQVSCPNRRAPQGRRLTDHLF